MKHLLFILFFLPAFLLVQQAKAQGVFTASDYSHVKVPKTISDHSTYSPATDSTEIKLRAKQSALKSLKDLQQFNAAFAKNSRTVFLEPSVSKIEHQFTSTTNTKVIVTLPKYITNVLVIDLSKHEASAVPSLITFTRE
ncbi:MAG: hypothetical protein JWP69_1255 [Flaviaesturariibacter sp.]|nr:hypothetical protein [Flaviaesturariibacter sp.]